MRNLEAAAAAQGITLDTMIPMGRPEEGIVKAADFKKASLIIVGSHGRTGLKRLLMGSVAERVIGHGLLPGAGGEEEVAQSSQPSEERLTNTAWEPAIHVPKEHPKP